MGRTGRVRIGNQTSYRASPPELPFDHALRRGFDAFEWFPDRRPSGQGWAASDLSPDRRRSIRHRALAADVTLSVHAPMPADPYTAHAVPGIRLRETSRRCPDRGEAGGHLALNSKVPSAIVRLIHGP